MAENKAHLKRHIGLVALILYGVGDILGAGIYGLVGKAAGQVGHAVWLAFLVSAIAAGLTGLTYASLGSRYPKAGGTAYVILRIFDNAFLSFVVGFAVLASCLTSMATATRVFAGYFIAQFPGLPLGVVMVGFAAALTLLIYRGIRETVIVNGLFTVTEAAGLLFIIAIGVSYWGSVDYLDSAAPLNPTGEITFPLIFSGAILTFYSFIGFEDILNVSEETKNPEYTIPRGLLAAVAISSIIYILVSITAVSVVSPEILAHSKQPLVDVVVRAAPWFPPWIFGFVSMFAVGNTALLNFVTASRLMYGLADHQLLPKPLARVHPRTGTPHVAVCVVGIAMIILTFSGSVATLAKATSVLLLICFTLMNIGLIVLKRKGEPQSGFSVPMFVPVLGAIICVIMLAHSQSDEWGIVGLILAAVIGLYFILRPTKKDIAASGV